MRCQTRVLRWRGWTQASPASGHRRLPPMPTPANSLRMFKTSSRLRSTWPLTPPWEEPQQARDLARRAVLYTLSAPHALCSDEGHSVEPPTPCGAAVRAHVFSGCPLGKRALRHATPSSPFGSELMSALHGVFFACLLVRMSLNNGTTHVFGHGHVD